MRYINYGNYRKDILTSFEDRRKIINDKLYYMYMNNQLKKENYIINIERLKNTSDIDLIYFKIKE